MSVYVRQSVLDIVCVNRLEFYVDMHPYVKMYMNIFQEHAILMHFSLAF